MIQHARTPGNGGGIRARRAAGFGAGLRRDSIVSILLMLLAAAGCRDECPDAVYELETPEPQVRLPMDDAPHCASGEWWYYTGRLRTMGGEEFGFESVVFHVAPGIYVLTPDGLTFPTPVDALVAHATLIDVNAQRFDVASDNRIVEIDTGGDAFDVSTGFVRLAGRDGVHRIEARFPARNAAFNLDLTAAGPPVLHGGSGYVPFGQTESAFYYSHPDMVMTGELVRDGVAEPVTGDAWFDRQYGLALNNAYTEWDWFSVRFDGGERLMIFGFPDASSPLRVGTLMNADRSVIDIPADDIVLEELEHWTSPHTGRRYAVRWRVLVASLGVDVELDRVMDDQELDTQQLPRVIYWEGMCRLTGTLAGQPAAGYAFIELANQFD
jgi:predicted secreted hydrolase